jgi:aminopeptidase N
MKDAPVAERDVLTQDEAEGRAARVSNVSYRIVLDLVRGAATYSGALTVQFELAGNGDLFFDHRGKTIRALRVNGTIITPDWNGYRLTIPAAALMPKNTVTIEYENDYDHGGDGFHQFTDPEDGEEYLYSNFEPYEAHRLFPCFDQPDIKATYRLTVTAPATNSNRRSRSVPTYSRLSRARTTPSGKRTGISLSACSAGSRSSSTSTRKRCS